MSVRPIPSLTGLRFVAAMCVVISHALLQVVPFPAEQPLWYTYFTQASGPGMTLFFVLSGFVIHYNYSGAIQQGRARGLFDFFAARFARLYPLYVLCVVLTVVWTWWRGTFHSSVSLPYYLLMMQSWFYAVIGDNNLIYQYGGILPITWSISTEWFLYIVYPAICYLILRLPRCRTRLAAGVALSVMVCGAMFFIFTHYQIINRLAVETFGPVADIHSHWADCFIRWLAYFSPYSKIGEFAIGCLTAAIFMELQDRPVTRTEARIGGLALSAALVGIMVLYRAMFGPPYSAPPFTFVTFMHMSFGFAPLIAVVIFCCARYRTWLSMVLSTGPIIQGGEISYSVYLLHLLALRIFVVVAVPVTSTWAECLDLGYLGAALLTTIGISFASYNLWERPWRRVIRRTFAVRLRPVTP